MKAERARRDREMKVREKKGKGKRENIPNQARVPFFSDLGRHLRMCPQSQVQPFLQLGDILENPKISLVPIMIG